MCPIVFIHICYVNIDLIIIYQSHVCDIFETPKCYENCDAVHYIIVVIRRHLRGEFNTGQWKFQQGRVSGEHFQSGKMIMIYHIYSIETLRRVEEYITA